MTAAAFLPVRSRSILDAAASIPFASVGAGVESKLIDGRLLNMRKLMSEPVANLKRVIDVPAAGTIADQLHRKLATLKQMTAKIAMHLDAGWRIALFKNLERLLDPDDWDNDFLMPSEQSFSTFLRLIIYLHPSRRPSLGLSPSGRFLCVWRSGESRIVVECLPDDEVRWVLSRTMDGDRESGAGKVQIHRLPDVVQPYDPETLFTNGDKVLA